MIYTPKVSGCSGTVELNFPTFEEKLELLEAIEGKTGIGSLKILFPAVRKRVSNVALTHGDVSYASVGELDATPFGHKVLTEISVFLVKDDDEAEGK